MVRKKDPDTDLEPLREYLRGLDIIPEAWFTAKEKALQELCDLNARKKSEGTPDDQLIKIKVGEETLAVGTEYSEELLDKYTHMELTNLTNFLAGRGKNQGKTYATRSFINENGDVRRDVRERVRRRDECRIYAVAFRC